MGDHVDATDGSEQPWSIGTMLSTRPFFVYVLGEPLKQSTCHTTSVMQVKQQDTIPNFTISVGGTNHSQMGGLLWPHYDFCCVISSKVR